MFNKMLLALVLLGGDNRLTADEPLELLPREAEVLAVMPRVTTVAPLTDPDWLYRGSIRPGGTFESPLSMLLLPMLKGSPLRAIRMKES